ncbi:MAG: hypothetical protein JWO59_2766 [Chloroflexi bacterium]|nr:hypothetical protein [Chloroflexota bacterium]
MVKAVRPSKTLEGIPLESKHWHAILSGGDEANLAVTKMGEVVYGGYRRCAEIAVRADDSRGVAWTSHSNEGPSLRHQSLNTGIDCANLQQQRAVYGVTSQEPLHIKWSRIPVNETQEPITVIVQAVANADDKICVPVLSKDIEVEWDDQAHSHGATRHQTASRGIRLVAKLVHDCEDTIAS